MTDYNPNKTGKYEELFNSWLYASEINEQKFIEIAKAKPFEIHTMQRNGMFHLRMTCNGVQLGREFIAPIHGRDDLKINIIYMLLFVAQKLDNVYGEKYFSDIVSDFLT